MSYAIDVLLNAPEHPARAASLLSIKNAQERNRDAWLGLYRDDAVIQDPIGASPLDPAGAGHRGKEAIAKFYDANIAPNELRFHIRQTFACGMECANVGTITTKLSNGMVSRTELIMIYHVDEAGQLQSMRAFWEFNRNAAEIF